MHLLHQQVMSANVGGGGGADAEVSFLQTAFDNASASTYTFASQNLGTADSGRYIVVGCSGRVGSAISSITVAGATATIVETTNPGGANIYGLAIAYVPTGTSGDVVITFGSTQARCGIAMWRLVNLDSATPHDTLSAVGNDPTGTIDVPDGGVLIAYSANGGGLSVNSWTGVTEDFDQQYELSHSAGSDAFASSETGRTVTVDWTGNDNAGMVAGSWG